MHRRSFSASRTATACVLAFACSLFLSCGYVQQERKHALEAQLAEVERQIDEVNFRYRNIDPHSSSASAQFEAWASELNVLGEKQRDLTTKIWETSR
jgi:hypothetical protein